LDQGTGLLAGTTELALESLARILLELLLGSLE